MMKRKIARARSKLYRTARILGDVEAAMTGPHKLVKRKVRTRAGRKYGKIIRRLVK